MRFWTGALAVLLLLALLTWLLLRGFDTNRELHAATLQALASKDNPVLIRIDTKSGHGASNLTKQLETLADIYSFVMFNMGVTPNVPAGSAAPSRD